MAGWIRSVGPEPGHTTVLSLPHLEVSVVRLSDGERFTATTPSDMETAAVFASGRCGATAGGRFWANAGTALKAAPWTPFHQPSRRRAGPSRAGTPRPRRRISPEFRPLAHTTPWPLHQALYLPPDTHLELQALEPAEVILFGARLRGNRDTPEAEVYGPASEDSREVGEGSHRRLVTPLITPGARSVGLTIGETYNPPGGWSTYPPHRHDRNHPGDAAEPPETQHEEVYVFRFTPVQGFGLARIYDGGTGGPGSDQTLVFEHADALAILQGYHTVCAAPGYHLHYLWALAGQTPAQSRNRPDPAHTWVDEQP